MAIAHNSAHEWLSIFPFLCGLGLVWHALGPGPFYPRRRTSLSLPVPTWKVRAMFVPFGILLSLSAAAHFRLPGATDVPLLRWLAFILFAVIVLRRSIARLMREGKESKSYGER
jgi:hypothetical protein